MKMDPQHHSLASSSSRSLRKLLTSHPQRSGDQESSQQGSDVRGEEEAVWGTERKHSMWLGGQLRGPSPGW